MLSYACQLCKTVHLKFLRRRRFFFPLKYVTFPPLSYVTECGVVYMYILSESFPPFATEQTRLSPLASSGKTSAYARHAAVGESAERPCLPAPGHGCAKTVPARSINQVDQMWSARVSRVVCTWRGSVCGGEKTGAKRPRDNSGDLKGTYGPPGCCSPGIFSAEESLCIEPPAYAPSHAQNRTHAAGDTQY